MSLFIYFFFLAVIFTQIERSNNIQLNTFELFNTSVFEELRLVILKYKNANYLDKILKSELNSNSFKNPHRIVRAMPLRTRNITILGLFELSNKNGTRADGLSELTAAKLAIKHINERKILGKYTLSMHTNDTQCDPGVGIDRFFHALYTKKQSKMLMLLGSACSDVTESLAKIVPYWNILQISYGATTPVLSDRKKFPLFFRTSAPDTSNNHARIAFIKEFAWDTVTVLSENVDVFSLAMNDLVMKLEQANVTCSATITFARSDFKNQMEQLKHLDTRIIFGSFSSQVAPLIFCEAYNLGMYGRDYVWILHSALDNHWWLSFASKTNCSYKQLKLATEGIILTSSYNNAIDNIATISNYTIRDFQRDFKLANMTISRFSPETYDAVWAMALAINASEAQWRLNKATKKLSVSYFDYTRKDIADAFYHELKNVNFSGISGPIFFNGPDRIGTTSFFQVQSGQAKMIALFHPYSKLLEFNCNKCAIVRWVDDQVPICKRIFKMKIITVDFAAFATVVAFSVFGIILAVVFLVFNFYFKRNKSIKLSSPRLNNMTAFGCILVYAAVILLGVDTTKLPNKTYFAALCTARVYLLSAGFSLAFGSMLTKTYRVHRIVTRNYTGIIKNKLLQDTPLILMICILLLIDGLIVTIWVVIDPMRYKLRNLTIEMSNDDRSVAYQTQVEVCISDNTNGWFSALYTYKGILLIVGIYMAWETRLVKIPLLNESDYIGMSVYSVVITSAIVIVIVNLISEQVTLAFLIVTTLILVSTTCILCLLFFPKVNYVLKRENEDQVVDSMGLKIECNTRRFAAIDDRNELRNRVEIQNSVYKKQIISLDIEISRLEKLLASSSSRSSSSRSFRGSVLTLKVMGNAISEKSHDVDVKKSINKSLPTLFDTKMCGKFMETPRASWPASEPDCVRRNLKFHSETKLSCGRKQSMLEKIIMFFGKKVSRHTVTPTEKDIVLDLSKIAQDPENSQKTKNRGLFNSSKLNDAWDLDDGIFTIYATSSTPNVCAKSMLNEKLYSRSLKNLKF